MKFQVEGRAGEIMQERGLGKVTLPVLRQLVREAQWDGIEIVGRETWEKISALPFREGVKVARKGKMQKGFVCNADVVRFFNNVVGDGK